MTAIPHRLLAPAEYLARERAASFKSEYYRGEMFAMAGASFVHTRIKENLSIWVGGSLQGSRCQSLSSDLRVKIPSTGLYTYPDFIIVCDPPELEDDHGDNLLNPTAIVEILSKSTEGYDRGTKFDHYRRLQSLKEYVLISQHKPLVERFVRQSDDTWVLALFSNVDGDFNFASVPVRIAMRNIYDGVAFPVGLSIAINDASQSNSLQRPEDRGQQ